ncbi:MAG: hypothetical protein M5U35_16710 [Roseovarius sp.]|nr:hypothetical protein [Roseovarius sp.]
MINDRTYLFALPEVTAPVGGVNVLLQIVDVLRGAGHDAAPLFASPSYVYPFWPHDGPAFHDPALVSLSDPFERRLTRLRKKGLGLVGSRGPWQQRSAPAAPRRRDRRARILPDRDRPGLSRQSDRAGGTGCAGPGAGAPLGHRWRRLRPRHRRVRDVRGQRGGA